MNRSRFAYPGPVKKWPNSKRGDSTYWDKETIRAFLEEVRQWQLRHQIADRNIFVGECGVSREAAGAERYLFDVLEIFRRVQVELGGLCLSRCRMGRDELRARHGYSDNASRAEERVIRPIDVLF